MRKVVVIVDDSDSVAAALAIALETSLDVRAIVAHHPQAALKIFETQSNISAVVTDFSLPFLDGFELIKALRKLHSYERLPALMISAGEDPQSRNPSVECRPNVILRKPLSFKEVCRVVQSFLE
jgi:DNA-binding response OmpR family regulator